MILHKSEIFTFKDLSIEAQNKVYNYFELLRFQELQRLLSDYKTISLNNRINKKSMFKQIMRYTNNFNDIIVGDCLSSIYLKDGYKINKSFLEIS